MRVLACDEINCITDYSDLLYSLLLFLRMSVSAQRSLGMTGFVNGTFTKRILVTHCSLFPLLLHSLPFSTVSKIEAVFISLTSRFFPLFILILGRLKCSKHTSIKEYESWSTMLYKPSITSHHSCFCQTRPHLSCFILYSFFCSSFTKLSLCLIIIFAFSCGYILVRHHLPAQCKAHAAVVPGFSLTSSRCKGEVHS